MEQLTDYFDTRYTFNNKRAKVWKAITEYLQKFVPENGNVLEIGAGYCDFINQIKAGKKEAMDINPTSSKFCAPNVVFTCESILNFETSKQYDVVFASNFFEHFETAEVELILDKLYSMLNPNGKLILIQPNYFYAYRNYWDDYTHKTVFSHNNLPDILSAHGFRTLLVKKKFLPFSFKSKLPTSYYLTKLYLFSPIKPMAKQLLLIATKNV